MKGRKIVSMLLCVSVLGSLCACKKADPTETETSPSTETTPAATSETTKETTKETVETKATSETTEVTKVEDESEDPILIYGYDAEFKDLMKQYLPDTEFEFVFVEKDDYYKKLDEALKSGEKTPDLFMCDKDHLQDYSYSKKTLDISLLGIRSEELEDQFPYTYEASRNADHVVKGLSYSLAPSAILYNRSLAYKAFGSDEPNDVMRYLESWDNILESAQDVNLNSEGNVKLLAGISDIRYTYWASHTGKWIKDGKVVIGKDFNKYFHIEEVLMAESLTFNAEYGSQDWQQCLNEGNTVMFFGSLLRAKEVIGYVPGHEEKTTEETVGINNVPDETKSETSGSETDGTDETSETTLEPEITGWAILPAPEAAYDDGVWLMPASTCDMKATAAKILRALTLDEANMENMALAGMFVNSETVMKKCAADPFFISDFLGGQNPYAVLVPVAERIKVSVDTEESTYAFREIEILLQAYLSGEIATMDEVKQQFTIGLEELFGLT